MIRKLRLDDNLPRKLSCAQKSCLGTWLIEPNVVISMLVMKLHTGNKRLQGKAIKLIIAQEELSFINSRLTKKEKKMNTEFFLE